MSIQPDTKDWTWVLKRPCPECDFDGSTFPCTGVASAVRDNVAKWPDVLHHPSALLRPSQDRWSALEYGCHVRDVFDLYAKRLSRMLDEDDPLFENWDQDQTALEVRYNEQAPPEVARDVVSRGSALASVFDSLTGEAWTRTGRRSDGVSFTIDTFSRYLLHDPVHHLVDVDRGFDLLKAGRLVVTG